MTSPPSRRGVRFTVAGDVDAPKVSAMPQKLFILSPAHCGGKRASFLFNDRANFELARKLRTPAGATLGETFSFLSGLYFRGKLAYARRFATSAGDDSPGAWTITTNRGL